MNDTVSDNPAQQRYELAVDGHVAASYYEIADGVITFVHTEVPAELGGKGIGSRLIKGALDQVRAGGLQVIAERAFVKAFIGKNPAYQDLLTTCTAPSFCGPSERLGVTDHTIRIDISGSPSSLHRSTSPF